MAGHSKWAQIRHKKAKVDAKRGKIFSKLIREITVAARMGGGDPDFNPRLRLAIERAKEHNMPWENIEKAIKRGTGELEGTKYETVIYEGYAPGGVAILVQALTDNKNRTTNEVRHLLSKHGGHMAGAGSVMWQFKEKGVIYIDKKETSEDKVLDLAIEAGAEDVRVQEDTYEIWTDPKELFSIEKFFKENNLNITQSQLTLMPQNTVPLQRREAEKLLKLLYALEELDDVTAVYSNFEIPEEILQTLAES